MRRFLSCWSLIACGWIASVPCLAGTYASTQLCWQSDGTQNIFGYCSGTWDPATTSDSGTWVTPNAGTYDQTFIGSASATATPDMWKVALDISLYYYRRDMFIMTEDCQPFGGDCIAGTGVASAETDDTITVGGGTGVYSLSYIFSLDGTLNSSDSSALFPYFCTSLFIPAGQGIASYYCLYPGDSVANTFTLTYADLPFGGPVESVLNINAYIQATPMYIADEGTIGSDVVTADAHVNFGSTVHLDSVLITDSNGNPIPGVTISSASGYQYPLDPRNVVPEPGCLAPLGLLALAGLRRRVDRRHRRT
jgi:hypothetical protein